MSASNEVTPWLERAEWSHGRAKAGGSNETAAYWFGAFVWNALGIPVGVLAWRGEITDVPPFLTYLLPLFTLVGGAILLGAIRHTLRRRRFKHLELELDPFPGALAGHAGGTVDLPSIRPGEGHFRAMLLCVHSRIVRTRNGKRTAEEVVWSDEIIPTVNRHGLGSRLHFTFDVPADLPPTGGEPTDRRYWAVRVTASLPGADLDEVFTVPVYATHPPRLAERPANSVPTTDDGLHGWGVSAQNHRGDLRISYQKGRGGVGTMMMIVFGLVFGGAGAGLFQSAVQIGGSSVAGGLSTAFASMFALIFVGIGALLLLPAVYLLLNSLDVTIGHGRVESVRSLLWLRRRREVEIKDLADIEASLTSQTGQGVKAARTYKLRARTKTGAKIALGDGIRGDFKLASLIELIEDASGMAVERKSLRNPAGMAATTGFLLCLCALVLAPGSASSQERAFPYSLGNQDRALVPAALISSGLGFYLTGRTNPITLADITALDAQSINGVDRGATRNWSTTWQDASDWSRNITVGAAGLLAAAPYVLDGRWSESVTLGTMFAETMTLVVGVTVITKGLANRTRPYAYNTSLTPEERLAIAGPDGHSVNLSFISGHTSMAFAAATLMSKVYSDMHGPTTASKIVWGTTMSAAALAAYARVQGGMHFSTDVMAGGAVGVAVGYLVPALHRVGSDHSLSVSPNPGGIQLRWAVGGWNPPHA